MKALPRNPVVGHLVGLSNRSSGKARTLHCLHCINCRASHGRQGSRGGPTTRSRKGAKSRFFLAGGQISCLLFSREWLFLPPMTTGARCLLSRKGLMFSSCSLSPDKSLPCLKLP